MSLHIDDIITRLGYTKSENLKYGRDGFGNLALSAHVKNVLTELSPYAVYFVDDSPFLLFYEKTDCELNTKIWNAQIPVTIVCGTLDVKVYASSSIDRDTRLFAEAASMGTNEVDEDSPFSFWEITNHNFWCAWQDRFGGKKLDELLLGNLTDITKRLRENCKVGFATKLVLRLIFIRYLIDRGVNLDYEGFDSDALQVCRESLLDLLSDKHRLYGLFAHLKGKFNGNLFELGSEIEDPSLNGEALQLVSDFLSARRNTATGQRSFFDMYDFNIIPVELIGNIYEILLGNERQKADKAYYTPQFLVDRILDDTIQPFVRDKGPCIWHIPGPKLPPHGRARVGRNLHERRQSPQAHTDRQHLRH